jgi:teichuronic acid biosynthesis glycosyltransferase TuaH
VFRVGSHHLARELSLLGYDVAHISTPYSYAHALLGKGAAGRKEQALAGPVRDENGVLQVVPRSVLPAQYSSASYIRRTLSRAGFDGADFMLIDQPLMVSRDLQAMADTLVYRPTDLYLTGIAARKQALAVELAKGIVATSEEVLRSLHVTASKPSMFLPNGVEFTRFSAKTDVSRDGAIYVGALDDRFDWDAIRTFALSAPSKPVRLAGPIVTPVPDLPHNVEVMGPVPYDTVPALLASAQIGLLPFSDAVSNRGRSPMKLYEYLAAGLYVFSRHTPVVASYSLPGVHLYQDHGEIPELLAGRSFADDVNAAGIRAAALQDWSVKAKELETFLHGL